MVELEEARDQLLISRWMTQRIECEKLYLEAIRNPEQSVLVATSFIEPMHVLDVFLSRGIGMMRMWGEEEDVKGQLRFTREILEDIRSSDNQLRIFKEVA